MAVYVVTRIVLVALSGQAFGESRFFDQPASAGSLTKGAADYRTYTITVEDGPRLHTIRLTDPVTEANLEPLVSRLRSLARPADAIMAWDVHYVLIGKNTWKIDIPITTKSAFITSASRFRGGPAWRRATGHTDTLLAPTVGELQASETSPVTGTS